MEESKEARAAPQVSNPPSTAPTLPPQPPPPPPPPPPPGSAALPPKSKKRPLESDSHLQHSRLFKIRVIIRDLRPRFIEVLRTPDFKNCQASNEIREQLKTLVGLCRQDVQESKANFEGKPPLPGRPSESKIPPPVALEKQPAEDGQSQGTYIVGGSAFGWNFITYTSKQAVYYGLTKEQFRAKYPAPCLVSD
ncbi:hypothetical protein QN277_022031 [Acacia crassicarpa]|uniref:Uncharacterized protein n=1 Tax=Acacia crassicarpa TaxID=499986 RepID=A0AAE1MIC1_9FABA|nr:hypothetical protein QN277_022031 [Acacia crassicarpa]